MTGCTSSQPHGLADDGIPVVVQAEQWTPFAITEAMLLAFRARERGDVPGWEDAVQRNALVREIEAVLFRIRDRYPAMGDVVMRQAGGPNSLILELESDLFARISEILEEAHGPVPLRTGYEEFDRLNLILGLGAVKSLPVFSRVVFYYDLFLDAGEAVRSYRELDGVVEVEPDALLLDGPDIDILQSKGTWYVVYLDAWGDCPSGCLNRVHHFFTVNDSVVKKVNPDQAQGMAEFTDLVMYLR